MGFSILGHDRERKERRGNKGQERRRECVRRLTRRAFEYVLDLSKIAWKEEFSLEREEEPFALSEERLVFAV